eukprot:4044433-Prymnesium_polylepis.1
MDAALDSLVEWTKHSVLEAGHAKYGKNAYKRQEWSAWADEQLALHHEEHLFANNLEVDRENEAAAANAPAAAAAPAQKPFALN